ncbi:unnamed protein product [Gulo gulo]|uniref:Uncharacterized protein n=1 Tax=Gulo gulo TaxID=48420 RepID=A0A9X9M5C5_GULGU|nr:unnamed protein product [Gulo gulo]
MFKFINRMERWAAPWRNIYNAGPRVSLSVNKGLLSEAATARAGQGGLGAFPQAVNPRRATCSPDGERRPTLRRETENTQH